MSFDRRDIRKNMDVYTLDNAYLGTVLRIIPGSIAGQEQIAPSMRQASQVSGELLGPMPTQPIGNEASIKQSAAAHYATAADADALGDGTLIVGQWWGLCGRRSIPISDIQTVSLERIVLTQRHDQLRYLSHSRSA